MHKTFATPYKTPKPSQPNQPTSRPSRALEYIIYPRIQCRMKKQTEREKANNPKTKGKIHSNTTQFITTYKSHCPSPSHLPSDSVAVVQKTSLRHPFHFIFFVTAQHSLTRKTACHGTGERTSMHIKTEALAWCCRNVNIIVDFEAAIGSRSKACHRSRC